MNILGLSAFYHDSAACLVRDGQILAAAQKERFTRRKHDAAFPKNAVEYCLREGGISLVQVGCVAFYEKRRDRPSESETGSDREELLDSTRVEGKIGGGL